MWSGGNYNTVALSKELVRITRHGKYDLTIDKNGFIRVDSIIPVLSPSFPGISFDVIERIVNSNDKKRFELKQINSAWMLKATQGHTVQVSDLGLSCISDPYKYETVLHGSYMKNWPSIMQSGLSRMKRSRQRLMLVNEIFPLWNEINQTSYNEGHTIIGTEKRTHIHFAIGLPGDSNVISGMPSSCDVVIYINMQKAMSGGIRFYESTNKVILSEGDSQGRIPTRFFSKVIQLRPISGSLMIQGRQLHFGVSTRHVESFRTIPSQNLFFVRTQVAYILLCKEHTEWSPTTQSLKH